MFAEVAPAVIVRVGSDALWELRRLFPQLKLDIPGELSDAGCRKQHTSRSTQHLRGASLRIVASSHLTGAFGMWHKIAAIGQAVGHALGSW